MDKKLCVIGSLNLDFTQQVADFPQNGETITSERFSVNFGGKGANQAAAIHALGSPVLMAGLLGSDPYGLQYEKKMAECGMDLRALRKAEGNTGIAVVTVNGRGENTIVITPGANALVDRAYLDQVAPLLLEHDIFLLQQEIPSETVEYAIRLLKKHGKTVILDPAPVRPISRELLAMVDYLTPNQVEASYLSGTAIRDGAGCAAAGEKLLQIGVRTVLIKAGGDGSYLVRKSGVRHIRPYSVEPLDTTGSGDAFNAGFAVALAEGKDPEDCARFANAVGALATTRIGAQNGVPCRQEVERFMREQDTFRSAGH